MEKYFPANAGDARNMGSISDLGRSSGVGNDNSLQNSFLGNSMDRGVCPWGHKESDTNE